jgi:hypothetical protein
LFNLLTGYSQGHQWRKLVVAPTDLHRRTLQLIDEQIQRAKDRKPSRIFAKINAIVDHRVIEALYRASEAGVPIDIVDRGVCCLRPGIAGVSDNIRVHSIVDRFLEHSRIYVFGPDSDAKVFLSSADWMPRNFYRRVEVMFPIEQADLRDRILHEILPAYLMDNVKSRILQPDGTYIRQPLGENETPFRVQERLLGLRPSTTASAAAEGQTATGGNGNDADGNDVHGNGALGNGPNGNELTDAELRSRELNSHEPTSRDITASTSNGSATIFGGTPASELAEARMDSFLSEKHDDDHRDDHHSSAGKSDLRRDGRRRKKRSKRG